ncbi:SIS domain-containing protein [Micromonospora sp. NPDC049301]|uniref:SIS domain-containing protein n=1 Tax=Micromonospora sp. NPDC049301 TaxID=3155723 RepID=UPI00341D015A
MSEGTFLTAEIKTQPDDWLRVLDVLPSVAMDLPQPGERVAVLGCGTSLFVAQAYAALRESAGEGITDAWPASEHQLGRGYDRVLCITRSGTTTEVLDVLKQRRDGAPTTVITADATSPAVSLARPIVLSDVDERSVVQTRFATTTLALLRAALGHDLRPVAEQARQILDRGADATSPAATADQITFLGRGWTVGLAHEAALKLRETTQLWTESYPAMEYRHGPLSITAPGRVVWAFGEVPVGLADQVRSTGGHFEWSEVDPLADLVRVQQLCLLRAGAAGLNPDQPRNLSRSVILDG